MNGLLVVLPVLTHTYADLCVETMLRAGSSSGLDADEVLVVDNTRDGTASKYGLRTWRHPDGFNSGVARSWNVGACEVLDRGLDYLVLMSSVMQFGPALHCTWRWQMSEFWGAKIIEAEGHSFHCVAIHRSCFEKVGLFDTNFHPAYFEAEDWLLRLRLVGWEGRSHVKVWFNALSQGSALHAEVVRTPAGPLLDYRRAKWGGDKGEETFRLPFENRPIDWFEDVPIPVLAERYGLGERGEGWW